MKKIYLFVLFAVTLTFSLTAQEIPQKQTVVITKIGATWCPNCGTTAWDNFTTLNANHASDAVIISVHPSRSSALHSTESIAYTENLPQAWGQPLFYVNRDKYSTNQILSNAATAISSTSSAAPMANTGLDVQLTGTNLEVYAKVKFFEAGNGEYYLSLLIIEDGVIAQQANRGSDANHKKLLRGSMTDSAFGQSFSTGAVPANTEFEFNLSKELPENWQTGNIEVAAIIYQKVGDDYQFINAHTVDAQLVTSINILEKIGAAMTIAPTIIQHTGNVTIELPEALDKVDLSIYNIGGQRVHQVSNGNLSAGSHNFSIEKNQLGSGGIYFLKMEKDGSVISKKFVVE